MVRHLVSITIQEQTGAIFQKENTDRILMEEGIILLQNPRVLHRDSAISI